MIVGTYKDIDIVRLRRVAFSQKELPMSEIKQYSGVMDPTKMERDAYLAYNVWLGQRARCSYKKHVSYPNYGAKGIRVEYSSREFVSWYLHHCSKKKFKKIDVGRIDHDKNYTLDNIEMIEHSENVRERNFRKGNPSLLKRRAVALVNARTRKEIQRFSSSEEASRLTGYDSGDIRRYCIGKLSCSRKGHSFRYIE